MIEQASLVIGEGNWAVKSDSLLGYKINGGKYYPREMSVVRATTATRINEDGLVELVPYNLLQQSNNFDTTWAINGTGGGTITSGQTDPNGETNAWIFSKLGLPGRIEQVLNVGGVQTFFIYAKKNTSDFISIVIFDGSVSHQCYFNLSTGTVGAQNASTGAIESVGNGWYKCIMTSTNLISSGVIQIYLSDNDGTITGTTGSVYIFNSQLVEGSSALDYLPTTDRLDVARIDYSSGSGALLVEPQRTNILTYSSSFDNADWTKLNSSTLTANTSVSPSGIQDADKFQASNLSFGGILRQSRTVTSGAAYTFSFFCKKDNHRYAGIRFNTSTVGGTIIPTYDFDTNTFNAQGVTGVTLSSQLYANGWVRLILTFTSTTTIGLCDICVVPANGDTDAALTGTESILVYGAQLELGSYPTSLIPTQAAAVTRNADVISKTGIADLIGQTEGTLFLDFYYDGSANTHMIIRDNGYSSYIYLNSQSANELWGQIQTANIQFSMSATSGRYKMALAYKSGSSALYVNGTQIGTSATTFTLSGSMNILDYSLNAPNTANNKINATALYKTRLTNAELATLTTI